MDFPVTVLSHDVTTRFTPNPGIRLHTTLVYNIVALYTSMDATAVKAEIKNWEHEFRAQNDRSATIEDIKALPPIGIPLAVLFRSRSVTNTITSREI